MARTWKVCPPIASGGVVFGELHLANAAPSTLHWNVPGSVDLNPNVGVLSVIAPVGPPVIVVFGGVASTTNERLAAVASALPAGSIARPWNEWGPSPSGAVVLGAEQFANAAPSTLHWKVEPGSFELNPNVGVLSVVRPNGPPVIAVTGGSVSTVKERTAAVGSRLRAGSIART